MKFQFEISGFNNNKNASYDNNTLSRFRNGLVAAITDQKILPKMAVIVPDDDLINYFCLWYKKKEGSYDGFERILRWLMCQYDRLITAQRDYLPNKAKRSNEPIFIWIEVPLHDNLNSSAREARNSFNKALQKAVSYHTNFYSLQLIKCWDESNPELYNKEDGKYTARGYVTYWEAIDKR